MITPFGSKYLIIMCVTALVTIVQMVLMEVGYDLVTFLYIFLSQILGPLIVAAFLLIVFFYTGRKITSRLVFQTYLVVWLIQIIVSFVIILSGNYQTYI